MLSTPASGLVIFPLPGPDQQGSEEVDRKLSFVGGNGSEAGVVSMIFSAPVLAPLIPVLALLVGFCEYRAWARPHQNMRAQF